jgi:hypothetical protein
LVGWRTRPKELVRAINRRAVDERASVFVWRTSVVNTSFAIASGSKRSGEEASESSDSSDISIGVRTYETVDLEQGEAEGLSCLIYVIVNVNRPAGKTIRSSILEDLLLSTLSLSSILERGDQS